MAEGNQAAAAAPSGVSEEALKKAEQFIEADEGAQNRLSGFAGNAAMSVAVAMSVFHLYAAIAGAWPFQNFPIISTQPLRYAHVAFVLILSFLLFPMAMRFRNRIRWWDVVLGCAGAAILAYAIQGGEDFTDRATSPTAARHRPRRHLHRAAAGGDTPHHRLDRAGRRDSLHRLLLLRAVPAATVDASRLRRQSACRPPVHHARRHLRHPGRRVVVADHPVHHLRRVPAALRRGKILHRFLDGADGQQGQQRRPHRGAVVVPARRAVGLGRRHHRYHRRGRLSDDGEGGLREERRGRPARGRRARRDHLAAGARRRSLPDRRVSQDQLSRRDLDGDHPDLSLLPRAAVHGRARRQALRRACPSTPARTCRCGN